MQSFGFGGDGWHAMEAVQSMVERRSGGETGVAEVRYLEGAAVWAARERGEFNCSNSARACVRACVLKIAPSCLTGDRIISACDAELDRCLTWSR